VIKGAGFLDHALHEVYAAPRMHEQARAIVDPRGTSRSDGLLPAEKRRLCWPLRKQR
jgi:hypothetical protein